MPSTRRDVIGGVDTHRDANVAAVIDTTGRMLAHASFPTSVASYGQLERWLRSHGTVAKIGVEGTGAWGPGWLGI